MARTIIISDIHHRHVRAQSIIDSVPHDKVVLLGDYFDAYNDKPEDAVETAKWLVEKVIGNPKIVPLLGNHDVAYIWPKNLYMHNGGTTQWKISAINDILGNRWGAFGFYHIDQNFVFSHAGVTNPVWKDFSRNFTRKDGQSKLEFFDDVMQHHVIDGIRAAHGGQNPQIFSCGWDRNGLSRYGGIVWCDWNSLSPINGINQVVGHSTNKVPRVLVQKVGGGTAQRTVPDHYKKTETCPLDDVLSISYGIDTGLNHYAVVEDGEINFYDFFTRTIAGNKINVVLYEQASVAYRNSKVTEKYMKKIHPHSRLVDVDYDLYPQTDD